jgi:hypothetical protein
VYPGADVVWWNSTDSLTNTYDGTAPVFTTENQGSYSPQVLFGMDFNGVTYSLPTNILRPTEYDNDLEAVQSIDFDVKFTGVESTYGPGGNQQATYVYTSITVVWGLPTSGTDLTYLALYPDGTVISDYDPSTYWLTNQFIKAVGSWSDGMTVRGTINLPNLAENNLPYIGGFKVFLIASDHPDATNSLGSIPSGSSLLELTKPTGSITTYTGSSLSHDPTPLVIASPSGTTSRSLLVSGSLTLAAQIDPSVRAQAMSSSHTIYDGAIVDIVRDARRDIKYVESL